MNNGRLADNPAIPQTSDRCFLSLGLTHNPFSMAPDVVNFFSPPRIETVVVEVLQLIESRMGFALLYGDVGLGKTTISRRILYELDQRGIETSLVFNTFYQGADLIAAINRDFGIEAPGADLQEQMSALNDFLLERRRQGRNCVIIIDDAQNLSVESLELVRQISNMETGIDKIVQIILIGQSELEKTLNRHELRQLKSRIVLKRFFKPYSRRETAAYIRTKLARGGDAPLVEIGNSAIRRIHDYTQGIPRRINVAMGRCLYAAVACNTTRISDRIARMAIRDIEESLDSAPQRRRSPGVALLSLFGILIAVPFATAYVKEAPLDAVKALLQGGPTEQRPVPQTGRLPETDENPPKGLVHTPASSTDPAASDDDGRVTETDSARSLPNGTMPIEDPSDGAGRDPASETATGSMDEPVRDFLSSYGLTEHLNSFDEALDDGDLRQVADEIGRRTGLRLVALPSSVEIGDDGYGKLFIHDRSGGAATQLVFWRPTAWSDEDFEFFYRKPQILDLQQALQAAGVYTYIIDGIAGDRTTAAIIDFQSEEGLTPTGVPDTETLFLLENRGFAAATGRPSLRASSD